jgi:hypothetical protein
VNLALQDSSGVFNRGANFVGAINTNPSGIGISRALRAI